MYAIVEIAGNQYRVQQSDVIDVPLLKDKNVGDSVEFTNILAAGDDADLKVGAPYLTGSVTGKVVEHGRGTKVIVFHKKRRKGYRKKNGHRQDFTQIAIDTISVD